MSDITLGLWPIAGITTSGVTRVEAHETIATAIKCGVRRFDTAFSYGYDGESDRLLGEHVRFSRDDFHVTSKVGQRWSDSSGATQKRSRIIDGSPKTLIADAETSLRRIGIEQLDCLMLHCPDPNVPIEESAEAIRSLQQRGLCVETGVCNVTPEQRVRFAAVANCDAIQCPLNLVQSDSMQQLIPACQSDGCDVFVFWSLMKGLLSGRINRDHVFASDDVRPSYAIFQGNQRERTHRIIDALREIGKQVDCTVAQLAIGWAMSQPGVTGALVGARRPEQVLENAAATKLPPDIVALMDDAATKHGSD